MRIGVGHKHKFTEPLNFNQDRIVELSKKYDGEDLKNSLSGVGYIDDSGAEVAGRNTLHNVNLRENFETIFRWKTRGRGINRTKKNSDGEISEALKLSKQANEARSAIAILIGLRGVHIPVASALLAWIHPSSFTIIDFRVLESLGVSSATKVTLTIDYYLHYLEFCKNIAKKHDVSLRTLDKALWQLSKDK